MIPRIFHQLPAFEPAIDYPDGTIYHAVRWWGLEDGVYPAASEYQRFDRREDALAFVTEYWGMNPAIRVEVPAAQAA